LSYGDERLVGVSDWTNVGRTSDALDNQFNSRGVKLAGAISTLVVSCFYLIPQMVGAGALAQPLIGVPHNIGVIIVGCVVTAVVIAAGMVSPTWVQFITGRWLGVRRAVVTRLIPRPCRRT